MATASPCIPHPEPCGMSVPWLNGKRRDDPGGWKMDALFCSLWLAPKVLVNPLALWEGCAGWTGRVLVSALVLPNEGTMQYGPEIGMCTPVLYIDGMCLNIKIIDRNWDSRKRNHPSNPILHQLWFMNSTHQNSEAWFHPPWAAFDHRRLRAALGVSRLWCWEGWGTWWDAKSSRVAILSKNVDRSPILDSRDMNFTKKIPSPSSLGRFTQVVDIS